MSRESRRAIMRPRERPGPVVLPFPSLAANASPGPVLQYHTYFVVNGVPFHLVGERWLAKDAANSPSPTYPDPLQPGVELTTRLEGPDGTIIQAVSYEVFQAYSLALQAGSSGRAAGAALGR